MIYTVTFNPAIDYVVHMPRLQHGSVNRVRQEDVFFGGKGINVSTVLQRLEGDTTRPLLARPDKQRAVQELFDRRLPLYRAAADVEVDGEQTPEVVAAAIAAAAKSFHRNEA